MTMIRVSVIVPSYSRPESIVRCVNSVAKSDPQPPGGVELVVVCSGYSGDVVPALRSAVEGTGVELVIVDLPDAVPTSMSRNIGVWAGTGTILFFVDDDNVLSPGCVYAMWQALTEWKDCCVAAPVMYWGSEPDRIWCAGLERSPVLLRTRWRTALPVPVPERLASPDFPNAFAVRTREFLSVGGFDGLVFPQYYEEADLIARLKALTAQDAFCVTSGATWHHIGREPHRRFHLTSAASAYRLARNRKAFIARHGRRGQRLVEVLLGRWLYLVVYLLAARTVPRPERGAIRRAYVRGVLAPTRR